MIDHRRTPGRKAYVLPGWFLTLTAAACVLGLVGLGWVAFFPPDEPTPAAAAPTSTPSPTPSPSLSPSPSPSESPKPKPKPEPKVSRNDITVNVLNATRTTGLAKQVAARITRKGWDVGAVGNWRTGAAQTAVHFPQGHKDEAQLLAKDLDINTVLPSTRGMRSNRLTVILLGLP
ncbi:MAG: LytR C-terminal domain-containing protein [Aeromicrobium sp.]